MPVTQIRGPQVLDGTIQNNDVDIATAGKALITKLVLGAGLQEVTRTGIDAGTGAVTVALAATIPAGQVTTLYIGDKARFVALSNGLRLEVQDAGLVWRTQVEWTE